ncbi:hypothetical protein A2W14_06985 [Candidatus Gottesmanbacteria bacterium RBG_16_37_8]|uniref:Aminopeptidase n=1 Tax=Candidatus Gottesmanbacteria bacterium RBG_16_37_8 TaxID=1798371 RepID=A0A1F5YSQ0_9BACT|nr:MAG: hypothetical protein A2W14_06985 [Candidatus Gottesmanbacteria bacterium RBG_16_37_8]
MAVEQEVIRGLVEAYEGSLDPFFTASIHNVARTIVEESTGVKSGQKVLIRFDPPGIPLVKELYLASLAKGADTRFFRRELEKDAQIIPTLDEQGIRDYFNEEEELINWADVILTVRGPENPEVMNNVPPDKYAIYQNRYGQTLERMNSGEVMWNLFPWPTLYDANKEGLSYEEYFNLVIEACNQPWKEIKEAQAILKARLDSGKILELIANEGDPDKKKRTYLKMSIEGMTFCNSTIKRNFPGSEVFSAPVLESVEGQIYAAGYYIYSNKLMKGIFLRIEKGRIVEAHAEEGDEHLQFILSQTNLIGGEQPPVGGARYFGEVALGTNPGLTRRFFNDFLNEKVAGSFHMAIGNCYTINEYDGDAVNVNNGNIPALTPIHWDLTILMHRNADGSGGGKVIVDGELIQKNGIFLDEKLAVLNPKF